MQEIMANSSTNSTIRALNIAHPLFFCAPSAKANRHVSFSSNRFRNRLGFRLSSGNEKFRPIRVLCFCAKSKGASLDLPLLPFQPDEVMIPSEFKTLHLYEARFLALLEEVMIPSEFKTLHLYEARFLALLEESMNEGQYQFVHFVLDPLPSSSSSTESSYAARHACLVFIENVKKLDIGALVSIRGVGRVEIIDIMQTEPYLRGSIVPMQDRADRSEGDAIFEVGKLKESLAKLNNLEMKLKPLKDEPLQTQIRNSMNWAEKEDSGLYDPAFLPAMPERVSFAALQPVSGSTPAEILQLQKRKLQAMAVRDTSERLSSALELVKHNIALVAAKLAIQSVEI